MTKTNDQKLRNQLKLNELRANATEFDRLVMKAATGYYDGSSLEDIDAAIDQWNILINQAPSVLKAAKLELLDRHKESK